MSPPREIRPDPTAPNEPGDDPWPTSPAERSLEVAPTPLARRRRAPDRAIAGAAIVLVLLGLAVVKPWQRSTETAVIPSPHPVASPRSMTTPSAGSVTLPDWSSLAATLAPRSEWGMRVLTDRVDSDRATTGARPAKAAAEAPVALDERWYPAETDWPGRRPLWQARAGLSGAIRVAAPASPIRLLALTSPAMTAPLDVRVWRVSIDGLERLQVDRPSGDTGLGDWFLGPPAADAVPQPAWPAGWFRVEILTAQGIERLSLRIDQGPATPEIWPPVDWPLVSPLLPRPIPVPSPVKPRDRGLDDQPARPEAFLAVGPEVVGLAVDLGEALTGRAAWLASRAGDDPGALPRVATIRSSLATGFGLRFPAGASAPDLRVVSLVDRRVRSRGADQVGWHQGRSGDAAWAVVDAPDGEPWSPGVYRVDASWLDAAGRSQRASYHVDVLPGGLRAAPVLLDASRRWAKLAGGSGVVAGSDALILPASSVDLRLVEQEPATSPTLAAGLDPECRVGAGRSGTREPIGVLTPTAVAVRSVEVAEIQASAQPRQIDVRAALGPVPGLVVLGLADPAGWASGRYAATLLTDDGPLTYGFCVD